MPKTTAKTTTKTTNDLDAKPILIAAAVILNTSVVQDDTLILIARRQLDAKMEAGKWEFPGGKLEAFEHPEQTVVREIKEELDLEIQVDRIFDVVSHVSNGPAGRTQLLMLCYLCTAKTLEFQKLDVSDARWISVEELADFDFAEADIGTVQRLRTYFEAELGKRAENSR